MKRILCLVFALMLTLAACDPAVEVSPSAPVVTPSEAPVSETPPSETPVPDVSPTPQIVEFEFTEDNFPKLDGSTANIPLLEAVKSVLLGKPREECSIAVSGTDNAYQWLATEASMDLIIAYEMSPQTRKDCGDKFEIASIGRDAIVFLTSATNEVDNLTNEQLRGIYSGEITNWSEVGGKNEEIMAYQRPEKSGSQTMMQKLVMGEIEMMDAPKEVFVGEMSGLVEAVAAYSNRGNAIGYNVYYYVTNMKTDERIKLMDIDGVAPGTETIRSGDYPFVNDFFVVIKKSEPEGSPARILFDWLQSDAGMALINHEGYVAVRGE